MYFEYASLAIDLREKEIRETMRQLYEWAQGLPDAN